MYGHVRKYRKKKIQIEAIQYTGLNYQAVCEFANFKLERDSEGKLVIPTLEGDMKASIHDFIIKGVRNELYPCKAAAFFDTYEIVE